MLRHTYTACHVLVIITICVYGEAMQFCAELNYVLQAICYSYSGVYGDRGGTVAKLLRYKSEGLWFDPSWCHWIFH